MDEQHPEAITEVKRLAHDLLQSVAIIQAVAGVAGNNIDQPSRLRDNLDAIEREAAVMGQLCQATMIDPVLDLPIDVAAAAGRAVERMRSTYSGDLFLEAGDVHGMAILGDEVAWERGLVNLIENACRAAGAHGKVIVGWTATPSSLLVWVSDSGPGFGEAASGRASLGLGTVMRLIEHHDGHLELRRSPLGGAQLTLVFPLARDGSANPAARQPRTVTQ